MEKTIQHSAKQTEHVEQVCAQLPQYHFYSTLEEEEEDEGGYKDIVEQTEVFTKSSRDDHDQECPVVSEHTFPHPTPSFEEVGMSEEMRDDLIKEIAWRLALQSMLEEEERERMRKEVVEDDGSEAEEVLDLSQGEKSSSEEGRRVEDASIVHAEDEVEVEEACTSHELHVISPPNFTVSLCHTKATSTSVPLGGCDGGQSVVSYLIWGNDMREEKKKVSRMETSSTSSARAFITCHTTCS
ncbi:unnamed protein product [Linum trigynum]|uniref:Uncharacterized protein n=1 Tax=Linum trigynum TaxID=586398 RepID=A0AAV2FQ96_9ROSI